MTMMKVSRQFGLWDSPITPINLARGMSFSDVAWDQSGTLVWREGRSDRGVIVVQPPDGQAARDLNSDYGVRARVGYGGGDFAVGQGRVYFVEAESGRLYSQPLASGTARPITPAFGAAAAPTLSPDGRWLLFVHTYEGQDALALVDAEGKFWPSRLVSGDDFYMQPCWHPAGDRIAWVAWNHPNMPWDGTWLRTARLAANSDGLPVIQEIEEIAGGEEISVFQAQFSPDGRSLAYVSDQSGWWQLYLYDLQSGQHRQLTHTPAEHGEPAWVQGVRTFGFSPDSRYIFFQRNLAGQVSLWQFDLDNGQEHQIPLEGYTSLSQLAVAPDGQQVALIASGSSTPLRVITCDLAGRVKVLRRATAEDLPAEIFSTPEHITWQGMDGGAVYGLYYAPHNPAFEGPGAPPLMVMVHGGPTSQRWASFNIGVQFFTSRGYAVLDVNYRGSTGYGREYRNMLRENWGIYDVQDTVSGAQALAEQGLVDRKRMVIMGGSAGGFTVLKALEDHPGFFKAGVCLYGVSNQFSLTAETHKFEARYNDSLIGPLPQAAELYRQRSPIFFVDKICDAMIIFQGEIDTVVPRSQSDEVVASLQRRGLPHEYYLYPGEGHGFRKTENIEHMYKMIDKFLQTQVIYT
jgi:dipeptidyl aminopeptidase/acylaminoacyl peptidase